MTFAEMMQQGDSLGSSLPPCCPGEPESRALPWAGRGSQMPLTFPWAGPCSLTFKNGARWGGAVTPGAL